MDLLLRPLALAAVATLALNDHVLKPWLHHPLTGKLSDVAGCFVLPLFIAAVLDALGVRSARARLGVGAGVTLVFFTALKSSPRVAAGVSEVLAAGWRLLGEHGGSILADPTDLIALPAIAAAWVWGLAQPGASGGAAVTGGAPCA
ncbi:MAG: hypothetical protein INH41_14230 [Myxococcaceae bacterium]|jgi:hypothetical protein|nr:hypothetical protein [Myxococcaceae bacterium]MCA3013536.1 hypothetical protein [Myxococcaceae bacterium]